MTSERQEDLLKTMRLNLQFGQDMMAKKQGPANSANRAASSIASFDLDYRLTGTKNLIFRWTPKGALGARHTTLVGNSQTV